jgi:hypothetical protein
MTLPTSEVLLTRFIAEYSLMVEQVENAAMETDFDRGWASAFIAVSEHFHKLLGEFQIEVSPPPEISGSRYRPIIRQMVQ